MEFNNKKLERTSKFINYVIAIVLCGFLIMLSGRIIDDVDEWKERPTVAQFEDKALLEKQRDKRSELNGLLTKKEEQLSSVRSTIKVVKSNYKNAKESYDNWLAARKTVGSPNEDKEILSRANELDSYFATLQDWEQKMRVIEADVKSLQQQKEAIGQVIDKEQDRAYKLQQQAFRKYDLKVFLLRLLFILPILLLAIFFIFKFRKHKYWPLFLGFVLFAFYAFFFGLVPYLPSYGGYIRYTVGIVIVVLLGIYAINKIKAFIAKKKSELEVSGKERAKSVQTETAEKALDNHMCPSCGKDFIVKKWDKTVKKDTKSGTYGIVTNFCRFCGLELFKKCNKCGSENYAHLPFCSNCGDHIAEHK